MGEDIKTLVEALARLQGMEWDRNNETAWANHYLKEWQEAVAEHEKLRVALQSIIDYEEDNYGELNYFKTIDAMKDIARKALGYQKESEK
jgi:hypothetical protein